MKPTCFTCKAEIKVMKIPSIVICPKCRANCAFVDFDNHPKGVEGAIQEILDSIVCRKCKRKGFNRFVDSNSAKCRHCKDKVIINLNDDRRNKFVYEIDI